MSSNRTEFWHVMYVMGVILMLTPALLALPGFLYAIITGTNFGVDAGAYAIASTMASGFIAIVYATLKIRPWEPPPSGDA